jgi:hypothetical protein
MIAAFANFAGDALVFGDDEQEPELSKKELLPKERFPKEQPPKELSQKEQEEYVAQAENYFNGLNALVAEGTQVISLGTKNRMSLCKIVMSRLDKGLSMCVNTPVHQLILRNGVLHVVVRGKVSRYNAESNPLYKVFSARPVHLDYQSVTLGESGIYIKLKSGVVLYFKLYDNGRIKTLCGWSVNGSKKDEVVSIVLDTTKMSVNDKNAIPAGIFDVPVPNKSTLRK